MVRIPLPQPNVTAKFKIHIPNLDVTHGIIEEDQNGLLYVFLTLIVKNGA